MIQYETSSLISIDHLHDESRSDDGRDAELHESSSVGGQDDSDPVEGVSRVRAHDAEQRDLVGIGLKEGSGGNRVTLKPQWL